MATREASLGEAIRKVGIAALRGCTAAGTPLERARLIIMCWWNERWEWETEIQLSGVGFKILCLPATPRRSEEERRREIVYLYSSFKVDHGSATEIALPRLTSPIEPCLADLRGRNRLQPRVGLPTSDQTSRYITSLTVTYLRKVPLPS